MRRKEKIIYYKEGQNRNMKFNKLKKGHVLNYFYKWDILSTKYIYIYTKEREREKERERDQP